MDPVTRKEMFLAKAGGQSVATPEPITREEIFLQRIAENGGSGGGSGGVPSWNDLTDKPFGEEQGRIDILAECQPTYVPPSDEGLGGFTIENANALVVGKTYTVNWNGTEYNCLCHDLSFISVPGTTGIGDYSELEIPSNNEPFQMMYLDNAEEGISKMMMIFPMDGTTELTISIYTEGEIVKKLDTKYLPDIPMIDLVALGMPAVTLGDYSYTTTGGEELKALMKKGVFQYKALFTLEEGVNIEVLCTVNGFSCEASNMYQAASLMSLGGTPVLLVLGARITDPGIELGALPLTPNQ